MNIKLKTINRHIRNVGIILMASLAIAACSASKYASSADKQYINSKNGNNINVPAPLSGENISHFYDLPNSGEKNPVSIVPPKEA